MLVTDDGIARLANEVHPLKAPYPMLVTDDGISRLANELHPWKARFPMLVTDDGIARLANELHPLKALSPMLVTDDGIVTLVTLPLSTSHAAQSVSVMTMVPSGMVKRNIATCIAFGFTWGTSR